MPCRLDALDVEAADPERLAAFWASVLRREVVTDVRGVLLPGPGAEVALRLVPGVRATGGARLHLHVTTVSAEDQRETVARAVERGARPLDVGQLPHEPHVVLADPEGGAFCVLEPGNAFLRGCGRLGELACDGPRAAGVFWAEALGWPLVWDSGQETAVRSPDGGTTIAWGGEPPPAPQRGRDRLGLVVVPGELDAEVDRLLALGATRGGPAADGVELADPAGATFLVRRARGR